ncbi:hypothetical protein ACFL5V_04515 [Fibrobacterota bacterium]
MHEYIQEVETNIYRGRKKPPKGELGRLMAAFKPELIIGHPTFHCEDNIGGLVSRGIKAAVKTFGDRKVAIIVADGTYNDKSLDDSGIEATIKGALQTLSGLSESERENVFLYAGPHEGWDSARFSPGKGNALKMMFEEMEFTSAKAILVLDGDLHNDMEQWQPVYKKIMEYHQDRHPDKNYFVTARYARHFVDASITRNVVGPLTTLVGSYVPGGISGDIMLSAGAVTKEVKANWDDSRRNYGTDIATTFDNIADKSTLIYEVYLGAKLHDVTDDAKLSIMPGQVIGAALERILYYEDTDKRISQRLSSQEPLDPVICWDSDKTGIGFINPGYTDVFDIDAKRKVLLDKFDDFRDHIKQVLKPESFEEIVSSHQRLAESVQAGRDEIIFMSLPSARWIQLLYEVLGYVLVTRDIENSKKALNYLYTAAFVEFCGVKLTELGYPTLTAVRQIQKKLGVDDDRAREFYAANVDAVVKELALDFYKGRSGILTRMKELDKSPK